MLKPIFYPYKIGSSSAKKLSTTFTTKRVHPNKRYRYKTNHLIINWGNSTLPDWWSWSVKYLNHPKYVAIAANKLSTFIHLESEDIPIPKWTVNKDTAKEWIQNNKKVFCRTILNGNSGQGIVVAGTTEELVAAPLYTQAIKKDKEFRVHVFKDTAFDFVQKKKRGGITPSSPYIRSHNNGWIFAREGVQLPDNVKETAIKAVKALKLDFGAVDICTDSSGKEYVLEINTAPGLEGTTFQKYQETIRNFLNA